MAVPPVMALLSRARHQGMQGVLWRCRALWPVPRGQQLLAVAFGSPRWEKVGGVSSVTSSSTALPAVVYEEEKGWDEENKEIPEEKLRLPSSAGAPKKQISPIALRHKFANVQPPEKPLQTEEWNRLRESFQAPEMFEEVMFNSMIRYNSSIDVAKSLLTHVAKSNGDIGYNLLVKYLALCVQQGKTSEICDVYDILKMRFKTLESGAYNLIVRGLSNSDQWRKALTLLEEIKKAMIPSRTNYESCIKAACRHQEMTLACELYHEMLTKDLVPTLDILQTFFDYSRGMKDPELQKELFGILLYFRENQIYPHKTLMRSIKLWFESGQCPVCSHQLEDSELSEEEYNRLSERIIRDVIHGTDTFRKTSPQVGNCWFCFCFLQLFEAVNCLAKNNARLLVLGRKHMLVNSSNWKREIMKEMQNKADFFFAENISEDDAFLLYATLRSGKHCKFVTRDFLRDHKACLSDSLTRHLFRKWQRGHQIVLFPSPAFSYDIVVQTTGDTWHIPYKDVYEEKYSYRVPRKWLCLHRKYGRV
uniref:Mitochondrial ribonuclease P catalytic subunit n=1 Tax=Anas platyrhynchos TaxID=8839 RepID=A0A8B9QQK7_ANAPL